jgi:hypothetical protein
MIAKGSPMVIAARPRHLPKTTGFVWVSAPGDYATFNSNHTPDGTRSRAALELFEATPDVIVAGGQIHARAVLPVKRTIQDSDGHSNKSQ